MPVAGVVQRRIEATLLTEFEPVYLDVVNESGQHNVPPGSESHFKVVIVAPAFDGDRPVQRHRRVNTALAEELAGEVHALALHTYTPDEWRERFGDVPDSPLCRGGGRGA